MANLSLFFIVFIMSFGIHDWMYAGGQDVNKIHGLIDEEVNLTCHLNSTDDVTWLTTIDSLSDIFNCLDNKCFKTNAGRLLLNEITSHNQAIRLVNSSVLSLTPKIEFTQIFKCMIGDDHIQTFRLISVNEDNLAPNCTSELPGRNKYGVDVVTLSCEVNSSELNVDMTLQGIGLEALRSFQNIIVKNIDFDKFNNIYNATCNVHFPEISITRSCSYPDIIKAGKVVDGNDIVVNCDHALDVETEWQLYNQDGAKVDIKTRSWSRKDGRSLLIRNISERDEGNVVVCLTKGANETNNGTIGFALISNIPGDDNSPYPKTGGRTPTAGDQHNVYLVLTLLFLSLWVVTTVVIGFFVWVKTKENMSDTKVASSSPSGNASRVSNGRSNENDTPLSSVGAKRRRDPDTTNTNNSAHNPAFEPETISIDGNRGNRQSNEGNHLYFTLEKSSPSPKTSTSRQERPGLSMNHPKGSQWQGYETVGDPNKGVFCSFDFGEYADVSFQGKVTSDLSEYSEVDATQFRGTAPPGAGEYSEVRRSFRGKERPTLPDRTSFNKKPKGEQVERDEISRLYGKVKK